MDHIDFRTFGFCGTMQARKQCDCARLLNTVFGAMIVCFQGARSWSYNGWISHEGFYMAKAGVWKRKRPQIEHPKPHESLALVT
jgi:hypothetical protein